MAVYTWNPLPTFEGRQINTQEEADAWVASLTDNELRDDNDPVVIRDVRITVSDTEVLMTFIREDSMDAMPNRFQAPPGAYALASKTMVQLLLEGETEFHRRFQPYPLPTE